MKYKKVFKTMTSQKFPIQGNGLSLDQDRKERKKLILVINRDKDCQNTSTILKVGVVISIMRILNVIVNVSPSK
jgi:hypothetical protein